MKNLIFTAAILILPVLGTLPARAFTIQVDSNDNPILPWTTNTIVFDYNFTDCISQGVTSDQMSAAVDTAFATWNSTLTSSVTLQRGAAVTTTNAQITSQTAGGNPLILCDANMSTDITSSGQPTVDTNNIPAVTRILRVDSGSHIALAVTYINAQSGKAANVGQLLGHSNVLNIVLTHEIGHAIGLGHSADNNALMYYDATLKTTLGLAQDDVDGVTYLYPRQELGNSKIFGCSSLQREGRRKGGGSSGGGGSGGLAAQFFGLLAICALITAINSKFLNNLRPVQADCDSNSFRI